MTGKELKEIVECGETSFVQFKREFSTQKEIAREIIAFANCGGGKIIFGIDDKKGEMIGLTYEEAQRTNNELGNTANEQIKPTIYIQTETVKLKGDLFVICYVPRGKDKPYKSINGEIWVKQGADKRRVTENNEILSLFQDSGRYKPELSALEGTTLEDLDLNVVEHYFISSFGRKTNDFDMPLTKLLQSQKIIDNDNRLTVAGTLFFGRQPQLLLPWFVVKAVAYQGNDIGGSIYKDSRDITGRVPKMFEDTLNFIKANLHYVQNGQNFNKAGVLEIPEVVLEEVMQNALVHLDINSPAAIRVLIFDNRIEIINSGALCEDISIDDIKLGVSKQRNPQMAVFGNRTMIYKGLGSGIPRILKENVRIDFDNQYSSNQFKVILWRLSSDKTIKSSDKTIKSSNKATKSSDKKELILQYVKQNGSITSKDVKEMLNISESYAKQLLVSMVNDMILGTVGANKNREYVAITTTE